MRFISKGVAALAVAVAISVAAGYQSAQAGFIGMPSMLGSMVKRISFGGYTLPPMAFTRFCMRYADQCKPEHIVFRGGPVRLTAERWDDLKEINKKVNDYIVPEPNTEGVMAERWIINPASGDCNDYAVSKRFELLKRGWPTRTLLLSEVVTPWGEHHLVLVVRTSAGDLVLDNLTPQIRPWNRAPYRWVRMQTSKNPNYWASLGERSV
jgi:predicted transglutaminase-like cysteine proteinase